jgi:hypothetical protein
VGWSKLTVTPDETPPGRLFHISFGAVLAGDIFHFRGVRKEMSLGLKPPET